mmetsp:Transcript_8669/g.18723  ORF Transcript_8669/g.18723 Transcript_8669/m.18723 type:complete len:207 (+) Transcript_8669:1052-1672(+)
MDSDRILHDSPMVGSLSTRAIKVSVARRDRLCTRIPKIIFGTDSKHRPIIEPRNFFVIEQLPSVLFVECLMCGVIIATASFVKCRHLLVEFFFFIHLLALLHHEAIPIDRVISWIPVALFHVNVDFGMIGIVFMKFIVENNIVGCSKPFWMAFESQVGLVAVSLATKIPASFVQGKTSCISRMYRIQSAFFSYLVFLSSPLTNDLV